MAQNKRKSRKGWMTRRLPILGYARDYNVDSAVCDAIAGVTVGLTVMPQSLAYAALAGLPPQYGLYSAFAGCMFYAIFGSCKDITIGPTALMSLMTYKQIVGRNTDFAVLLCFMTGCIQLLMGFGRLGSLIDFISIPVTVGFTSATSVIIAVSQLKGLLGLNYKSTGDFKDAIGKIYRHSHETNWADFSLGCVCIICLLFMRKLKDIEIGPSSNVRTPNERIFMKILWLISTSRNVIIVVASSLFVYFCSESRDNPIVALTGYVKSGLPPFAWPPFSTVIDGEYWPFLKMCEELSFSVILVPVIAVLGNIAIAKAFSSGESVDATQELYALGLCNVAGSFVSSMPVAGSFSRSAVNHVSGVKTPLGGLYTGVLIVSALSLLTPYFYYIPKASLAAVIICAVIFMIEYEVVKPMWKASRKDLIPTTATFVSCLLLGVETGILIGVAINIMILLKPSARPHLHAEKCQTSPGCEYLMLRPVNSIYFPAVDFLRVKICEIASNSNDGYASLPVVIDCRLILEADFTAAKGIAALIGDFKKRHKTLYFLALRPRVLTVLQCVAADDFTVVASMADLDEKLRASLEGNEALGGGDANVNDISLRNVSVVKPREDDGTITDSLLIS